MLLLALLLPGMLLAHGGNHHSQSRFVLELPLQGYFEVVVDGQVREGSDRLVFTNLHPGRHSIEIFEKIPYHGYDLVYKGQVRTYAGDRVIANYRAGQLRFPNQGPNIRYNGFADCHTDADRYYWIERNRAGLTVDLYFHYLGLFHTDSYRWKAHRNFGNHYRSAPNYRQRSQRSFKSNEYKNRVYPPQNGNNRGGKHTTKPRNGNGKGKGYKPGGEPQKGYNNKGRKPSGKPQKGSNKGNRSGGKTQKGYTR